MDESFNVEATQVDRNFAPDIFVSQLESKIDCAEAKYSGKGT